MQFQNSAYLGPESGEMTYILRRIEGELSQLNTNKKETKAMKTQSVIMEFCEKQQQFHLNYHTVKENSHGYRTLQILENPDEAHFICEFLQNVLDSKGEDMTFDEMKMQSNVARLLLYNYNEAILNTQMMN